MEPSREKSICVCTTPEATLWAEIAGRAIVACKHCGIKRSIYTEELEQRCAFYIGKELVTERQLLEDDLKKLGILRRTETRITLTSLSQAINPVAVLEVIHGLLTRIGMVDIEVPDTDNAPMTVDALQPGRQLWYFNAEQLSWLLKNVGFTVVSCKTQSGFVSISAMPDMESAAVKIYGPPGIGDILWTLNKLRCIRKIEAPCRIHYVVCTATGAKSHDRAKDLLAMCPLIDSFEFADLPLPSDTGNFNPAVPVYNLIANFYLEPNEPGKKGFERIEGWRPEIMADFDLELKIPGPAYKHAQVLLGDAMPIRSYAALYFSSGGWNDACTAQQAWFPSDWARLCLRLHDAGIRPVIMGSDWDRDYFRTVRAKLIAMKQDPDAIWLDLLGKTTLPVAMAIMECADINIGICAGLPMVAAYLGWPTIMLWPETGILRRPVQMNFGKEFQTNWIPPRVLESGSYSHLSFGTFDEEQLAQLALFKTDRVSGVATQ